MPLKQLAAIPRFANQTWKQVSHDSEEPHAKYAEHDQMSVSYHPIRKVDQLLESQSHLHRALSARQEVEHHPGVEPANWNVGDKRPSTAPQRRHEVDDHGGHDQFDGDCCDNRSVLKEHRNRRVEKMVNPVKGIKESQAPKTDQRQAVAPNGVSST